MTAVLLVVTATLAASFLCSLLEAALYAVTPTQLEVMRKKKVFGARRFAKFRESIEEPIAAILTINTISHTAGSTVAGALVAAQSNETWLGVFTALFTLAILLLTEIVPKSVGVRYAPRLVPYLVWPLQVMIWISLPVAKPSQWLMHKLVGGAAGHGPTEDEIIAMSKAAGRHGELTELETRWVENVLLLDQVTARDIMTPRTVVQAVPVDKTVAEMLTGGQPFRHSRTPAYEGDSLDRIVGVVHRRDLHDAFARGEGERSLRDLLRPLDMVPEGMRGPELLEKFLRGKRHIVAVIDEYGGFEGIVTLEDVLECLVGQEIVDEYD
ncbi:MAG: HlyC/CorC family transporter, partial [Planctomycetes bacterium]|nr:HlyC/CorC family transporter [Planctomycetota bacterium]